jgi:hypothetical protein
VVKALAPAPALFAAVCRALRGHHHRPSLSTHAMRPYYLFLSVAWHVLFATTYCMKKKTNPSNERCPCARPVWSLTSAAGCAGRPRRPARPRRRSRW